MIFHFFGDPLFGRKCNANEKLERTCKLSGTFSRGNNSVPRWLTLLCVFMDRSIIAPSQKNDNVSKSVVKFRSREEASQFSSSRKLSFTSLLTTDDKYACNNLIACTLISFTLPLFPSSPKKRKESCFSYYYFS
jgi:hypothetical protein